MTKVLHLSHHYGCLKDHQYVCDQLGLKLKFKRFDDGETKDNEIYNVTPYIANKSWKNIKINKKI